MTSAIPLLTKGRGEGEGSNVDMNYFLGIDSAKRVLAADFEDTINGGNHPVLGRTAICDNIWYHAAATYDGTTWRLFLNGELEATVVVGAFTRRAPTAFSTRGSATAMTSTGAAAGFFKGSIDEARIWNVARSQAAIADTMDEPVRGGGQPDRPLGARRRIRDDGGQQRRGARTDRCCRLPAGPAWDTGGSSYVTGLVPGNDALRLTTGDYVTFGPATLGARAPSRFTVETWFKREGAGTAIGTGTNGLTVGHPAGHQGPRRGRGEQRRLQLLPGHQHRGIGAGARGRLRRRRGRREPRAESPDQRHRPRS